MTRCGPVAERRMRQAYHAESTLMVERDKTHLGAAVGLQEGMVETLSTLRLVEHPPGLRAAFNQSESMIEICREHSKNVKRWRDGLYACCALVCAGMLEADHKFRCVNGHLNLPKLRAALEAHFRYASALSQMRARKRHGYRRRHRSSTELGTISRCTLLQGARLLAVRAHQSLRVHSAVLWGD
jgi:hypothetical protein